MARQFTNTGWRAEASGPVHTTHAGRLAMPVTLSLGGCVVAVVDLVLDGMGAEQLFAALSEHLAGRGVVVAGCAR